jgi:hypothetical protein
MSFIRIKEIGKRGGKRYKYAYLVENKWRKRLKGGRKGSRQKVGKYLGKVLNLEKTREIGFIEFNKITDVNQYLNRNKSELIEDLVRHELFLLGFEAEGNLMKKDELIFDIKSYKFVNDSGEEEKLVIEANEGFICSNTLKKLLMFKPEDDDEHITGIKLAKLFLEAGLSVSKEVFVGYFNKI